MRTKTWMVVVFTVLASFALAAGCGDDDDEGSASSTSASAATGGDSAGSVNPEYETWCTSVQNLVDQSSAGDLSALADLAALSQAVTSLSQSAPEPIAEDMENWSTGLQAKVDAAEQEPPGTVPPEIAVTANRSAAVVETFVAENCGGVQLPEVEI